MKLTTAHHALVEREVKRVLRALPSSFDADDARSGGYEGLASAMKRFDPRRGFDFEAFARPRVRGAIIDSLRELTPFGRTGYAQLRALQRAHALKELRTLEEPSPSPSQNPSPLEGSLKKREPLYAQEEAQEEAQWDTQDQQDKSAQLSPEVEASFEHLRDLALSLSLELLTPTQVPIDEVLAEDSEREERSALLSLAFERLPERDQTLIIAVYDLRDTGDCAARYAAREGLSRSNVSYKHKSALARLRAYVLELSVEGDL